MTRRALAMIAIAPVLMAPLCPSSSGGSGGEAEEPAPASSIIPALGRPRPISDEPYTGGLGCRLVPTAWLDPDFPISMTACGNYSAVFPFAIWDSVPARRGEDGAFGRGYRLTLDTTLHQRGDEVVIRSSQRELHFARGPSGWVPEPYLSATLESHDPDPAAQDDELFVMTFPLDNSRFIFERTGAEEYALGVHVDRHGRETRYERNEEGRLERITDTVVAASGTENPWWYSIRWSGNRVERIEDASGRIFDYRYDAAGNLSELLLPGDWGTYLVSYAPDGEVIEAIELPGIEGSTRYQFDAEGRLASLTGPEGQTWTVVVGEAPAPDHSEIAVTSADGVRWAARLREIPGGLYVSSREARGKREIFERTDTGYLRMAADGAGRTSSIYVPHDGPRAGQTMRITNVVADGSIESESELHFGPYRNLTRISRRPGETTLIEYAGVDDCPGSSGEPWAFLLPCRMTEGVGDPMAAVTTMAHRTEAAGTPDERRITVMRNSARPLSDGITIRNRFGQPVEQRTARGMRNRVAYGARGFAESVSVSVAGMADVPGHVSGSAYDAMGRSSRQSMGPVEAPETWAVETTPTPEGFEDGLQLRFQGEVVKEMTIEERHATGLPTSTLYTDVVDGMRREIRVRRPRDGGGRRVGQSIERRDPLAPGELAVFRSGRLAAP